MIAEDHGTQTDRKGIVSDRKGMIAEDHGTQTDRKGMIAEDPRTAMSLDKPSRKLILTLAKGLTLRVEPVFVAIKIAASWKVSIDAIEYMFYNKRKPYSLSSRLITKLRFMSGERRD
jgi:hypothetical protein